MVIPPLLFYVALSESFYAFSELESDALKDLIYERPQGVRKLFKLC